MELYPETHVLSDVQVNELFDRAEKEVDDGSAAQLQIFARLYLDVQRPAVDQRRLDRLLAAIARSGHTESSTRWMASRMDLGVQRSVKAAKDRAWVLVMIDELDDPKKRWFLAPMLNKAMFKCGWPPGTLDEPLQRILDILGPPRWLGRGEDTRSLWDRALQALSEVDYPDFVYLPQDLSPPTQVWSVGKVLFTDPEAAQAYYEFRRSELGMEMDE